MTSDCHEPIKACVAFESPLTGVIQPQHQFLADEVARLKAENKELRAALAAEQKRSQRILDQLRAEVAGQVHPGEP